MQSGVILPKEILQYDNPTFNKKKISHTKVTKPLFENDPDISDVVKGGYKDSFLLSSLISILSLPHGKDIIKDMFEDKGDRVIVRLFDDHWKPHYLSIEKSTTANLSPGALWVQMLEKAFAAFNDGDYTSLNNPYPLNVNAMLTGANYDGHCSLPFQSSSRLNKLDSYVNGYGIYAFNELMRLDRNTPQQIRDILCGPEGPGVTENELRDWEKFLKDKKVTKNWQKFTKETHPIQFENVFNFLKKFDATAVESILAKVIGWVQNKKMFSGKRSSGNYSSQEVDMFNNIQTYLADGRPIIVSAEATKDLSKNVIPNESYAVVGVEDKFGLKYVKIMGPAQPAKSKTFSLFCNKKQPSAPTLLTLELSVFSRFNKMWSMESASQSAINDRISKADTRYPEHRMGRHYR